VTGVREVVLNEEKRSHERESEERDRDERIDRLIEELDESIRKTDAILDRWRAQGILRSDQPRHCF
jgi:hypothetical protein